MKEIDGGSVGLQFDDVARTVVDYDEQSGTYRSEFDLGTRTASEAVIQTVSQVSDIDPMRLPPLYSTVDPDALDTRFSCPRLRQGGEWMRRSPSPTQVTS